VLDANVMIRAVLGRRVWELIDTYAPRGVRFFAPDAAFDEAETYVPAVLAKYGRSGENTTESFDYLHQTVELIPHEAYCLFEKPARQRLRGRDEDDWPVLATALTLGAAIWSEDTDFFGTGIAVWTTNRVEIYLNQQVLPGE